MMIVKKKTIKYFVFDSLRAESGLLLPDFGGLVIKQQKSVMSCKENVGTKRKGKANEGDSEFTARIRGPPLENRSKYSKWSSEENRLYMEFLQENLENHDSVFDRRPAGYFAKMAQFLRNGRSKEQCRSHHQKFLLKYKSPERIISVLQQSVARSPQSEQGGDKTLTESEISQKSSPNYFPNSVVATEIEMKLIDESKMGCQVRDFLFEPEDNDILLSLIY